MALFYDPHDQKDQQRVVRLLQKGRINYTLKPEPVKGDGPLQIHVDEKDMARASDLLLPHGHS